jgi:hypothetical protein
VLRQGGSIHAIRLRTVSIGESYAGVVELLARDDVLVVTLALIFVRRARWKHFGALRVFFTGMSVDDPDALQYFLK